MRVSVDAIIKCKKEYAFIAQTTVNFCTVTNAEQLYDVIYFADNLL